MYCVLEYDGTTNPLPRVPFDYAVLRLDDACPAGAKGSDVSTIQKIVLLTTILRVTYGPTWLMMLMVMLERYFALCLPIITRTCRILSVANMPFLPTFPMQI
jgi:hypothetical protein